MKHTWSVVCIKQHIIVNSTVYVFGLKVSSTDIALKCCIHKRTLHSMIVHMNLLALNQLKTTTNSKHNSKKIKIAVID